MTAIEILRAASRSVPNEDYVQFMAAVDAVGALILFADTAEKALRNAVTAEQIHQGNLMYADDLRTALANVGGAA